MIDWKSQDPKKSDTELAELLGCTRQNVTAARKRLGWPASPESQGGDRKSLNSSADSLTIRGVGKARVKWAKAAKENGMNLNDWIVSTLDSSC